MINDQKMGFFASRSSLRRRLPLVHWRFWAIVGTLAVCWFAIQRSEAAPTAEPSLILQLANPSETLYAGSDVRFTTRLGGNTGTSMVRVELEPGIYFTAMPGTCSASWQYVECEVSTSSWSLPLDAQVDPGITTPATRLITSTLVGHAMSPLTETLSISIAPGRPAITATPQPTTAGDTPTATPSGPMPTAVPTPDAYEPNNTLETAKTVLVGVTDKLNFWPARDVDFFKIDIKPSQAGLTLTIQTYSDFGLDTSLRLFRADGSLVAENDDVGPTEMRSRVAVRAEAGTYIVETRNVADVSTDFKIYRLDVSLSQPATGGSSPTSTPAPMQGDKWENNYDFQHSARIAVGDELTGITFICPASNAPGCGDNDFYRFQVKGGLCYTAETYDLAPGVDTNLIIYGPQQDLAAPWTGNDDYRIDSFASKVYFCTPASMAATEAYALIGNSGNIPPPDPIESRTYNFRVAVFVPPTPTSIPTPLAETPTIPFEPTSVLTPIVPRGTALPAPIMPTPADDAREVVRETAPSGWAKIKVSESALYAAAPPTEKDRIATYVEGDMIQLIGQAYAGWVKVIPEFSVTPGWMWAADLAFLDTVDGTITPPTVTTTVGIGTPQPTSAGGTAGTMPTVVPPAPLVVEYEEGRSAAPSSPPALQARSITVIVCRANSTKTNQCGTMVTGVRVDVRATSTGTQLGSARTDRDGKVLFSVSTLPKTALQIVVPTIGLLYELTDSTAAPIITIMIP